MEIKSLYFIFYRYIILELTKIIMTQLELKRSLFPREFCLIYGNNLFTGYLKNIQTNFQGLWRIH